MSRADDGILARAQPFAALLAASWQADGRSLTVLARAVGCDRSYLSKLLAARRFPSAAMVATLAQALGGDARQTAALFLAAGYAPPRCPHCGQALEGAR